MSAEQKNMISTETSTKKIRRKYPRKDDVVLNAAEDVFLELGYAATSMDAVAARAGVSKRTVYNNFKNKEELFASVILKRRDQVWPENFAEFDILSKDVESLLVEISTRFLTAIYSSNQISLYLTIVAAARRFPKVGKFMYEGPILQSQTIVEDILRVQCEAGKLSLPDPRMAAIQLLALLKTDIHMRLLFSQKVKLSKKDISDIAESCIKLFLHGALAKS